MRNNTDQQLNGYAPSYMYAQNNFNNRLMSSPTRIRLVTQKIFDDIKNSMIKFTKCTIFEHVYI